jgi:redox-sensing transcriptional repressor
MAINRKCVIRLSRYKNALIRLKSLGFIKVFSDNLADATGGTPSQVRKDFSLFGISGNRRGGYKVEELIGQLNEILGKNEVQKVIIVGMGHIGTALLKYHGFEIGGIKVVAGFDIDPAKYDSDGKIPVLPLEKLNGFVCEHNIKIGILAVPDVAAQHVSHLMASAGVKGILNFAPIRLRTTDNTIINNINLEIELENLIYFVNIGEKTGTDQ